MAISRADTAITPPIGATVIESPDNMVLEVEEDFFDQGREAFALVTQHKGYRIQRTDRAIASSVIEAAIVLLSASGVMSLLNAALLAAGTLILTGA